MMIPILTNNIGPEDFGRLSMFDIMVGVISPLITYPLASVSVGYHKKNFNEYRIDLFNSIILAGIGLLVVLGLCYAFEEVLASQLKISDRSIIFLPPAVVALGYIYQLRVVYLQQQQKALSCAMLQITYSVIVFGVAAIALLVAKFGWVSKIYGYLAANVILSTIAVVVFAKSNTLVARISKSSLIDIAGFSLPIMLHTLFAGLYFIADRFMLSILTDIKTVGIYSAAMQVALVMSLIQDALGRAWMPMVMSNLTSSEGLQNAGGETAMKINLIRKTYIAIVLLTIVAVIYTCLVIVVSPWLYSADYSGAEKISIWLAWGFFMLGLYKLVVPYLWYTMKGAWLSYITGFVFLFNVTANLILIPRFGVLGACYALFSSFTLQFVVTAIAGQIACPMPWRKSLTVWS